MRKIRLSGLLAVLTCIFSSFVSAAPRIDIYAISMADYVSQAQSNADMKIKSSEYLQALKQELNDSSEHIFEILEKTPSLQRNFVKAHEAFLRFVETNVVFAEDISWFDAEAGTHYSAGTNYGYIAMTTEASLYWLKLKVYRKFLKTLDSLTFSSNLGVLNHGDTIGGYSLVDNQSPRSPQSSARSQIKSLLFRVQQLKEATISEEQ
jgi:hypothetical protein